MLSKSRGVFRVGTSGIALPVGKASFPAAFQGKSRLSYYSSLLNSIEINSTFKKIPQLRTLQKWYSEVPESFQFTIKMWKDVTHIKQLNSELMKVDGFITAIQLVGNKSGCLLIQFPASITANFADKVEQILLRIQQLDANNVWRKAVEFRHLSWYESDVLQFLKKFKACPVLHDMPNSNSLHLEQWNKNFMYYRFHGPTGNYRGTYDEQFLRQHAQKMRASLTLGRDVYVYFNNTMGSAFQNAMDLKAMVQD